MTRVERVRIEKERCRVVLREKFCDKVIYKVRMWLRHMKYLIGDWSTKKAYKSDMNSQRIEQAL